MKTLSYFLFIICLSVMSCSNAPEQQVIITTPFISTLSSGTNTTLNGVFFEDAAKGYIVGDSGAIISTTDGGTTWSKVQTNFINPLYSCFAYNGIVYVGGEGIILYGDNITTLNNTKKIGSTEVRSLTALGDGKIIAVGGYFGYNTTVGKVFVKNQNENTWSLLTDSLISLGTISDVVAIGNNNVIWCVPFCMNLGPCAGGLKNFDLSLSKEATITTVEHITALSKNNSLLIGVGKSISRSVDNGLNWSQYSTLNSAILTDIAMTRESIGFACGEKGVLLRTEDGGVTWSALSSGVTENLNALYFPTSTVGYAVGDEGTIIRLT